MMISTAPLVLFLLAGQHGLWQAAGQATGAAAAATGQSQLQATAKEAALAAARGDKNTETLLHGQKQATNMLRSMLMANSQQMFAINNLQKEVARMRTRLDKHEAAVSQCHKKLKEYESAQEHLATDAALADTIEAPQFLQLEKHESAQEHLATDAVLADTELKAAGFSAKELKAAGFSDEELKAAGFSDDDTIQAPQSFLQLKP